MARTGCAFAAVTCLGCPARTHRDRQVLPAYGLQDLPIKTQNPSRGSKPNTMWLPITLGESLGRGHFYLAETRTFLLCVDRKVPEWDLKAILPNSPNANLFLHACLWSHEACRSYSIELSSCQGRRDGSKRSCGTSQSATKLRDPRLRP